MSNVSLGGNNGTSINFDGAVLQDAQENEYRKEEEQQQNELKALLTNAFDDLIDDDDILSITSDDGTVDSRNVSLVRRHSNDSDSLGKTGPEEANRIIEQVEAVWGTNINQQQQHVQPGQGHMFPRPQFAMFEPLSRTQELPRAQIDLIRASVESLPAYPVNRDLVQGHDPKVVAKAVAKHGNHGNTSKQQQVHSNGDQTNSASEFHTRSQTNKNKKESQLQHQSVDVRASFPGSNNHEGHQAQGQPQGHLQQSEIQVHRSNVVERNNLLRQSVDDFSKFRETYQQATQALEGQGQIQGHPVHEGQHHPVHEGQGHLMHEGQIQGQQVHEGQIHGQYFGDAAEYPAGTVSNHQHYHAAEQAYDQAHYYPSHDPNHPAYHHGYDGHYHDNMHHENVHHDTHNHFRQIYANRPYQTIGERGETEGGNVGEMHYYHGYPDQQMAMPHGYHGNMAVHEQGELTGPGYPATDHPQQSYFPHPQHGVVAVDMDKNHVKSTQTQSGVQQATASASNIINRPVPVNNNNTVNSAKNNSGNSNNTQQGAVPGPAPPTPGRKLPQVTYRLQNVANNANSIDSNKKISPNAVAERDSRGKSKEVEGDAAGYKVKYERDSGGRQGVAVTSAAGGAGGKKGKRDSEENRDHQDVETDFMDQGGSRENQQLAQLQILYKARGRKVEELKNELDVVKADSGRELRILKHKLSVVQGEKEGSSLSLDSVQSLLQESKGENSKLVGRVNACESQIDTLKKTKDEMIKKLQTSESTIETLHQHLEELGSSDTLTRARYDHEHVVSGLQKKHDTESKHLKETIDKLQKSVHDKNEEVKALKQKLVDSVGASESQHISHAETINRLTQSLEESQKRCRNLLEASSSQEICQIKIQLQQALASRNISDEMCSSLQEEIQDLKEHVQMLESVTSLSLSTTGGVGTSGTTQPTGPPSVFTVDQNDSLADLGIKKTLDFDTPQGTPTGSRTQSHSVATHGGNNNEVMASLKSELERCMISNKQKRTEVTNLKEEMRKVRKDLHEFKQRCERSELLTHEQKKRISDLESCLSPGEKTSAVENRLRKDIDNLKREKKILLEDVEELQTRLTEISKSEERLTDLNQELSKQIAEMVREYDQDKRQAVERAHRASEQVLETSRNNLRQELQLLFDEERGNIIDKYEKDCANLREELRTSQDEIDRVKDEYCKMCEETDRIKAELKNECDTKVEQAKHEVNKVTEAVEDDKAKLIQNFENEKIKLRENFESEFGENNATALEKCREENVTAVEQLKANHKATVEEMGVKFENDLAALKEGLEKENGDILERFAKDESEKIEHLKQELVEKDLLISRKEDELHEKEAMLSDKVALVEKLETEIRENEVTLNEKVAMIEKLEKECKDNRSVIESLKTEYKYNFDTFREETKITCNEVNTLRNALIEARKGTEEAEELRKALSESKTTSGEVVSALRKEINEKTLAFEASKAVIEGLRKELAETDNRSEEGKQLTNELAKSAQEIESLRNELLRSSEEMDTLRSELVKSDKEIEKLRAELTKSCQEMENMRTDLVKSSDQIDSLKRELVKKTDEVTILRTETALSSEQDKVLSRKVREISQLNDVIKQLTNKKDTEVSQLKDEVRRLKDNKGAEDGELNNVVKELTSKKDKEISKKDAKISELNEMVKKLTDDKDELESVKAVEIGKLKKEIEKISKGREVELIRVQKTLETKVAMSKVTWLEEHRATRQAAIDNAVRLAESEMKGKFDEEFEIRLEARLEEAKMLWQTSSMSQMETERASWELVREEEISAALQREKNKWRKTELPKAIEAERQNWAQDFDQKLQKEKQNWGLELDTEKITLLREFETRLANEMESAHENWNASVKAELENEIETEVTNAKEKWLNVDLPAEISKAKENWMKVDLISEISKAKEQWMKVELVNEISKAKDQWLSVELSNELEKAREKFVEDFEGRLKEERNNWKNRDLPGEIEKERLKWMKFMEQTLLKEKNNWRTQDLPAEVQKVRQDLERVMIARLDGERDSLQRESESRVLEAIEEHQESCKQELDHAINEEKDRLRQKFDSDLVALNEEKEQLKLKFDSDLQERFVKEKKLWREMVDQELKEKLDIEQEKWTQKANIDREALICESEIEREALIRGFEAEREKLVQEFEAEREKLLQESEVEFSKILEIEAAKIKDELEGEKLKVRGDLEAELAKEMTEKLDEDKKAVRELLEEDFDEQMHVEMERLRVKFENQAREDFERMKNKLEKESREDFDRVKSDFENERRMEYDQLRDELGREVSVNLDMEKEVMELRADLEMSREVIQDLRDKEVQWRMELEEKLKSEELKWRGMLDDDVESRIKELREMWEVEKEEELKREVKRLGEVLESEKLAELENEVGKRVGEAVEKVRNEAEGDRSEVLKKAEEQRIEAVKKASEDMEDRLREELDQEMEKFKVEVEHEFHLRVEHEVNVAVQDARGEWSREYMMEKSINTRSAEASQCLLREEIESLKLQLERVQEETGEKYQQFIDEHKNMLEKALKNGREQHNQDKAQLEERYNNQIKLLQAREKALHDQLGQAQEEFKTLQDSIAGFQNEKSHSDQERSQWLEDRERLMKDIAERDSLLGKADVHLSKEIDKLRSELQGTYRRRLEAEMASWRQKMEAEKSRAGNSEHKEKLQLEKQLSEGNTELSKLRAQLQEDRSKHREEVKALNDKINSLQKSTTDTSRTETDLKKAKELLKGYKEELMDCQQKYEQRKKDNVDLSTKLHKSLANQEKLQGELQKIKEDNTATVANMQAIKTTYRVEFEKLRKALETENIIAMEKMKKKMLDVNNGRSQPQEEAEPGRDQDGSIATPTLGLDTTGREAEIEMFFKELRAQYLDTVHKIKDDALRHVEETTLRAAQTIERNVPVMAATMLEVAEASLNTAPSNPSSQCSSRSNTPRSDEFLLDERASKRRSHSMPRDAGISPSNGRTVSFRSDTRVQRSTAGGPGVHDDAAPAEDPRNISLSIRLESPRDMNVTLRGEQNHDPDIANSPDWKYNEKYNNNEVERYILRETLRDTDARRSEARPTSAKSMRELREIGDYDVRARNLRPSSAKSVRELHLSLRQRGNDSTEYVESGDRERQRNSSSSDKRRSRTLISTRDIHQGRYNSRTSDSVEYQVYQDVDQTDGDYGYSNGQERRKSRDYTRDNTPYQSDHRSKSVTPMYSSMSRSSPSLYRPTSVPDLLKDDNELTQWPMDEPTTNNDSYSYTPLRESLRSGTNLHRTNSKSESDLRIAEKSFGGMKSEYEAGKSFKVLNYEDDSTMMNLSTRSLTFGSAADLSLSPGQKRDAGETPTPVSTPRKHVHRRHYTVHNFPPRDVIASSVRDAIDAELRRSRELTQGTRPGVDAGNIRKNTNSANVFNRNNDNSNTNNKYRHEENNANSKYRSENWRTSQRDGVTNNINNGGSAGNSSDNSPNGSNGERRSASRIHRDDVNLKTNVNVISDHGNHAGESGSGSVGVSGGVNSPVGSRAGRKNLPLIQFRRGKAQVQGLNQGQGTSSKSPHPEEASLARDTTPVTRDQTGSAPYRPLSVSANPHMNF